MSSKLLTVFQDHVRAKPPVPNMTWNATDKSAGWGQRRVITLAVIRAAASEARYAITSATWSEVATWNMVGVSATSLRTSSFTHPVSVTGGWTMFAVTPYSA